MTPEEFAKEYFSIVERAMWASEKARREGLLALEDVIIEDKVRQRHILELGLRLVIDGMDAEIVNDLLTNIINLEEDSSVKK
jgi:flagellar motor component MotA